MDYGLICKHIVEISRQVGEYLREENKRFDLSAVELKGKNDYVTYVDKESERRLVEALSGILPGAGFLTEEGSVSFHSETYYWVVDPVDGTTNFIHKLPPYAISIALMKEEEILLGCVYEVGLDEAFYAWKGGGAWKNGEKLYVSLTNTLNGAFLGYGIPYHMEDKYNYLRTKISAFYGMATLRHLGSAATELCYVAAGRLDAYFHDNLSRWDIAAGAIILEEAGGKITDFSGRPDYISGKEVVATNGSLHAALLEFLRA